MKGNTYTGVVIGIRKRNSLNASFNLLFRFCGVQINMQIKLYSPMLNDLKIMKKGTIFKLLGTGNLRKRLNYLQHKRLTRD